MSVYKKSLHAFFLKVHPDFFARIPEQQRANEAAIARLNELLDWTRQLKAGTIRPAPATAVDFSFYRKPDVTEVAADVAPRVTARFELPKGFTASANSVGLAERAVNRFLRDLLRKAECLEQTAEAASKAQEEHVERMDRRAVTSQRHKAKRGRQGPEVRTLADAAADSMVEMAFDYSGTDPLRTPSLEFLIDQDHIHFERTLSPVECAAATQRLQQLLPEMQYEAWYGTPLLFTARRDYSVGRDVAGCVSIPWDFQLRDFLYFLRSERDALRDARERIEQKAEAMESLIGEICRALDADDVLITCAHEEAIPALQRLREFTSLLHISGCGGLTVEISDHFGFRLNGVLVLSKSLTQESLVAFVSKIEPQLPDLRQRHAEAKRLLDAIEWNLEEFSRDVKAHNVDAYSIADKEGAIDTTATSSSNTPQVATRTAVTYQDRLQWAQELQRIGGQLAKYDWSEFTFALGALRIDWAARLIVLPVNFDGNGFVRYVEEMQKRVQEAEAERLKNFESLRSHADAADRAMRTNSDEQTASIEDGRPPNSVEGGQPQSPSRVPRGAKEEDFHRYAAVEGYSSTKAMVEEVEEDDAVPGVRFDLLGNAQKKIIDIDATAETAVEAMQDAAIPDDVSQPLDSPLADVAGVDSADALFEVMNEENSHDSNNTQKLDAAAVEQARRDSAAWRSEYMVPTPTLRRAAAAISSIPVVDPSRQAKLDRQSLLHDDGRNADAVTTSGALKSQQRDVARQLTSSGEDVGDTLSIEQPLAPDRNAIFQSEQDATEQLEWEGFYQSPYAAAVPARDSDEVAEAFMQTNRWHREKAVQQMVYEMREKYGKTSRYEAGFKLGDVMGINDPKKKARTFPKVARGAYPGDGRHKQRPE